MDMKIDFVIPWVDGNDPKWQEKFNTFNKKLDSTLDARSRRFRDMGLLKYWFRCVEKFAPWVNKVYFVTDNQVPEWLDTDNPKLVLINHEDYIPKEYLPTFSANTIELNLHRIPELSEHFVYFNDDMFVINKVSEGDFFKNGLPCDSAVMDYCATDNDPPFLMPVANTAVLNRHFTKKDVFKHFAKAFSLKNGIWNVKNIQLLLGKFLPGFAIFHLPTSFLKSSFEVVWDKEKTVLDRTCRNRIRSISDVNQWLIKNWQICEGKYSPRRASDGKFFDINNRDLLDKATNAIKMQKYKLVCVNDNIDDAEYDSYMTELVCAFEKIVPDKCSFEKM